jgi:plastocyanin
VDRRRTSERVTCGLPPVNVSWFSWVTAFFGLALLGPFATATARSAIAAEPRYAAQSGPPRLAVTGALEGYVRLAGESRPGPTRVRNTTDPDVCGLEHSLEDLVWSTETGGIQHVIATVVDVPMDPLSAGPPRAIVIDNHECRFMPHVGVARVGDTIVATNGDPILHTTHYYGPLTSNVALPVEGMAVSRVFRRPGIVSVLCDVHGWMRAFVRVDIHPFHAVSDETGFLRISGIPPGSYTVELWHEKLGERQVQVEIRSGETTRFDAEYVLTSPRPSSGPDTSVTPP